jgi:hypothetical protein
MIQTTRTLVRRHKEICRFQCKNDGTWLKCNSYTIFTNIWLYLLSLYTCSYHRCNSVIHKFIDRLLLIFWHSTQKLPKELWWVKGAHFICVYIYKPKKLSFNELSRNTLLSFRNLEVTVSCLVLDKLNVFKLQCRAKSFNLNQNKTEQMQTVWCSGRYYFVFITAWIYIVKLGYGICLCDNLYVVSDILWHQSIPHC